MPPRTRPASLLGTSRDLSLKDGFRIRRFDGAARRFGSLGLKPTSMRSWKQTCRAVWHRGLRDARSFSHHGSSRGRSVAVVVDLTTWREWEHHADV